MSVTNFQYFDDWRTAILRCECCGWTGTFEEGLVEIYRELMDSSCPACEPWPAPMLAIVSYPTLEEAEANREKMSESDQRNLDGRKSFMAAAESTRLKSEDQLPELSAPSLVLDWDFVGHASGGLTVIKFGEQAIWSEVAYYEGKRRFEEVVSILKKKYGARLTDLVPTRQSEIFLYGDDSSAGKFVESIRASIRTPGIE